MEDSYRKSPDKNISSSEEMEIIVKKKAVGNILFVGELYVRKIYKVNLVHECLDLLL